MQFLNIDQICPRVGYSFLNIDQIYPRVGYPLKLDCSLPNSDGFFINTLRNHTQLYLFLVGASLDFAAMMILKRTEIM